MCSETTDVWVQVPADLSSTGRPKWCREAVDSCIAPIVEALVKAGIDTRASCCGHGQRHGKIILPDGRWLLVCTEDQMDEIGAALNLVRREAAIDHLQREAK